MIGQPGHNTRPRAGFPPSFLGMDAWTTSQLTNERSFDSHLATRVIDVHGLFSDMLS